VEAIADMLRQLSRTTDPALLSKVVGALRGLGSEFYRIRGYLEQGRAGILAATAISVAAVRDLSALDELRTISESFIKCDEYSYASIGMATALIQLNRSDVDTSSLVAGAFLRAGGQSRDCVFETLGQAARWLADRGELELLREVASVVRQTESWWS
jgi:hypothetical protein